MPYHMYHICTSGLIMFLYLATQDKKIPVPGLKVNIGALVVSTRVCKVQTSDNIIDNVGILLCTGYFEAA